MPLMWRPLHFFGSTSTRLQFPTWSTLVDAADVHIYCDPKDDRIGCGICKIKMKLAGPIPEHLPMFGKLIKIFHVGILM